MGFHHRKEKSTLKDVIGVLGGGMKCIDKGERSLLQQNIQGVQ